MTRPLVAEEGHEFFSFPRFNEPALKVGIHLRIRSVTTLPHENRYTRRIPHRLRDAATAPRVARINASLVRDVSRETIDGTGALPHRGTHCARTLRSFDQKPYVSPNGAFLSLVGSTVHILAHSFTCTTCVRRTRRSTFDKIRHQTHTTNAHLSRPSSDFGKMCIIVTSYF